MTANRLGDYLDHIRQATADAISFVEGLSKEEFLEDRRTQQAVVMSLIIIGEVWDTIQSALPDLLARLPVTAV